jgi:hypothetical protein
VLIRQAREREVRALATLLLIKAILVAIGWEGQGLRLGQLRRRPRLLKPASRFDSSRGYSEGCPLAGCRYLKVPDDQS